MADLGVRKTKKLEDTWKGRPLYVRKPSLRLAFSLQGMGESPDPQEVAEAVYECLYYADNDERVFSSADEALQEDYDDIVTVAGEISAFTSADFEEAEKN